MTPQEVRSQVLRQELQVLQQDLQESVSATAELSQVLPQVLQCRRNSDFCRKFCVVAGFAGELQRF